MYNYEKEMKKDIRNYLQENEIEFPDREELYDDMFCNDSITGNASGSYTFNHALAKEYVLDNTDLCREALMEFCVPSETVANKFLSDDFEYFDVIIRCYLLGMVLDDVLEEEFEEVV